MSDNIETIRSGYESFSRGDLPTVLELFADDIEWNEPEGTYGTPTGTFRGKQEVLSIFEQIPEYNDSFSLAGVPQLIGLLGHVSRKNPCSEAFRLVRTLSTHRYTFRDKVLAI